METTVFDIVGNILNITLNDGGVTASIVKEFTFDTLQQCWNAAQLFNEAGKGSGYVMVCWPMPVDALTVLAP